MSYDLNLIKTDVVEFKELLTVTRDQGYHTTAVSRMACDAVLGQKEVAEEIKIDLQASNQLTVKEGHKDFTVLSRLTIDVSEPRFLQQINDTNKIVGSYDLVAIRPKNQKIFHSVCVQYDFYDIISFDMSQKLPYMLKRNPVYEAIRKGKYFELNYGSLFDSGKRRLCLTNCLNLIKATKGKNLIVSSQVSNAIYRRTGDDLCSLLVTLGLSRQKAHRCLNEYPQKCIRAAKYRKSYKGIVSKMSEEQVEGAKKLVEEARKGRGDKMEVEGQKNKKVTVGQAFKNKHLLKLQKMKQKMAQKQNKMQSV